MKNVEGLQFLASKTCFRCYDIIAGGLSNGRVNSLKFSATVAYAQDDIALCMGRARPIPTWQNLFYYIRSTTVLVIAGILSTLVIVAFFFMSTFDRRPFDGWSCFFLSIHTVTYATTMIRPTHFMYRCLHIAFQFLALVWTTLFTAFLLNILARPIYEHQITSLLEIDLKNCRLTGSEYALYNMAERNSVG